ncbi:MAG: patatin family protein [Clostridia bacterium]|nr:patatin family protein [Clostridia bacterium]
MNKVYSGINKIPKAHLAGDIQKGCVAIEGGAFRGLYNEGVLDCFLLNNINIHTVIGVSAGALEGVNYVAGHVGRAARVNLGYRHDSRYIGLKALMTSHCILNLNFLTNELEQIEPLDYERLTSSDRHFISVVTNCTNGQTEYFDKDNCNDILLAAKASATMPYISPMAYVNDTPYLDGGCSCAIPYQWALDNDFEKIVVIKTRERGFRVPDKKSQASEIIYRNFPEFASVLAQSDIRYNQQCDEIDRLEEEGRIFVIAPSEPVTINRVDGDMEKLGELYWLGFNDANNVIDQVKEYLGM